MKDKLAEALLVREMDWGTEDIAQKRPYLQAMAKYKYDGYEQFLPGRRFIESLVLWLHQFKTPEERRNAYDFIMKRLIFISQLEMANLVKNSYPDLMRHLIIQHTADQLKIPKYMVKQITENTHFKTLRRQSLFLGLSDGTRTDLLRRSNRSELSNEQIYQTHEITERRANKMLASLSSDMKKILGHAPKQEERCFKIVFLLDDFTGSGFTYLRKENGEFEGKLATFYKDVSETKSGLSKLLNIEQCIVYLVFYVATTKAINKITDIISKLWVNNTPQIKVLQKLDNSCCVSVEQDPEFYRLCLNDDYYDGDNLEDESTKKGGTQCLKFGFADCSLPVVLAHNTPNNSVSLLWAYEHAKIHGLFPRVPRHKELV